MRNFSEMGRKRKPRGEPYPAAPPNISVSGPMDAHVVRKDPNAEAQLLQRGGGEDELPSLLGSISPLSPAQGTPPGNPAAIWSSPESGERPLDQGAHRQSSAGSDKGETATLSPGLPTGQTGEERGTLLRETVGAEGGVPERFTSAVVRPAVFTLETIWETLVDLKVSIMSQIKSLSDTGKELEDKVKVVVNSQVDMDRQIMSNRDKIKNIELTQTVMIKDRKNISMKLEQMENTIRSKNLRFINFPQISLISPRDIFKRYL
ncbi:proline-rich protein 15-like protein isoform X1 [Rhinatrema bivittatum]|uniref:proline-rich protein 15-like protein isoform X1 n=1 Tax=Rhinatrema bivittatum TaxID=194408 RepID=UPI00112D3985|nr:proline-rich protein 15-like protein isoform X1 [Rhinatrema bivittatum]